MVTFLHDLPPDVLEATLARGEPPHQSDTPFEKPWPLDAWPHVPTRFLLCRQDRLFPADFQRRVVRERLGVTPDEMDGGHPACLGQPDRTGRATGGMPHDLLTANNLLVWPGRSWVGRTAN